MQAPVQLAAAKINPAISNTEFAHRLIAERTSEVGRKRIERRLARAPQKLREAIMRAEAEAWRLANLRKMEQLHPGSFARSKLREEIKKEQLRKKAMPETEGIKHTLDRLPMARKRELQETKETLRNLELLRANALRHGDNKTAQVIAKDAYGLLAKIHKLGAEATA